MKDNIRWQLTLLRDKEWMPDILVRFIDWLRYGILNDSDLLEEDKWKKQEDEDVRNNCPSTKSINKIIK